MCVSAGVGVGMCVCVRARAQVHVRAVSGGMRAVSVYKFEHTNTHVSEHSAHTYV